MAERQHNEPVKTRSKGGKAHGSIAKSRAAEKWMRHEATDEALLVATELHTSRRVSKGGTFGSIPPQSRGVAPRTPPPLPLSRGGRSPSHWPTEPR